MKSETSLVKSPACGVPAAPAALDQAPRYCCVLVRSVTV